MVLEGGIMMILYALVLWCMVLKRGMMVFVALNMTCFGGFANVVTVSMCTVVVSLGKLN